MKQNFKKTGRHPKIDATASPTIHHEWPGFDLIFAYD